MTISPDRQTAYFKLRSQGWERTPAAKKAGIAYNSAKKLDGVAHPDGRAVQRERVQETLGAPIPYDQLSERAKRGFDDFAFFQRTYLGRIPIPWQVEAAEEICRAVESDEEEWIVVNCPPGSGKSTNFTHDLPAWITVRNRRVTGLLGSAVQNTSEKYINRLKNTLERAVPLKADPKLIRLGLAVDAEASLAADFGRFKTDGGIWAADQFVVEQPEGALTAEKEPTWSAFGRKGGVLGMRYQFVIWDDLVDPARLNSSDLIDEDREWYSDIAESRLEPGGTFILQGQRLGPNDLYNYALSMRVDYDDADDETEFDEEIGKVPKYRHIKYRAHYEELCEGNHKLSSPAYGEPGGCLLYPRRLSWKRLSGMMSERLSRFRVVYQQEEVDPETVLVQKHWVAGDGEHVGCWDKNRDRLELPVGVDPSRLISVVTVDPSPANYWAIAWWAVDPETNLRYLIDLERRGMGANKWIDYIVDLREYRGVGVEMYKASVELGMPISHWIVETNAAQKFMNQYDMIQNWQKLTGIKIIPQDTYKNKSDANYGVQTMGRIWEDGKVRLPGRNGSMGRIAAMKLVDEVTSYPHSRTTDCVMAQWFLEWHLPELIKYKKRRSESPEPQHRPSWLATESRRNTALAGATPRLRQITTPTQRILEMAGVREAS